MAVRVGEEAHVHVVAGTVEQLAREGEVERPVEVVRHRLREAAARADGRAVHPDGRVHVHVREVHRPRFARSGGPPDLEPVPRRSLQPPAVARASDRAARPAPRPPVAPGGSGLPSSRSSARSSRRTPSAPSSGCAAQAQSDSRRSREATHAHAPIVRSRANPPLKGRQAGRPLLWLAFGTEIAWASSTGAWR